MTRRYPVRLTLRQLQAIDSALAGYEPDPCHNHDHRGPCPFGWSPAEIRALDTAALRIARALRRTVKPCACPECRP